MRRHHEPVVPMSTASPIAGTGMYAASIFVLKATPTNNPASSTHRSPCSESSERITAHAAATRNRIMNGSGRLSRLTATLIGLSARMPAETVAAAIPNRGRIVHHRIATAAAPAIALGSIRLVGEKPKIRTLRAWIHVATGGLSTVM